MADSGTVADLLPPQRPVDQMMSSLAPNPAWGPRYGGMNGQKGNGYFGPLLRPDGNLSSELSFDFDHNGKSVQAPLIVPTLNKSQLDELLSLPDGKQPSQGIYDAAQQYAIDRLMRGKPTFSLPNEVYPLPSE